MINRVSLSHYLKAITQLPPEVKSLMTITKGCDDYLANEHF